MAEIGRFLFCNVSPMCHYSRRRKALFCFLENKMSKNITIPGV